MTAAPKVWSQRSGGCARSCSGTSQLIRATDKKQGKFVTTVFAAEVILSPRLYFITEREQMLVLVQETATVEYAGTKA